jgi:threonine dehydrogenase-like Zn-dependent dehydrogenase
LQPTTVAKPTELGPGEVLLRVLAGGICGSDLPKFRGAKGLTMVPGGGVAAGPAGYPLHEVVGEVSASRDPDVVVGSRVVGWAVRSDGLAEYVITDGAEVAGYDPGLSPQCAVLIQSVACVLYALDRVDVAGRRAAVIGLGPMGLLLAHALKAAGAAEVIGVDPVRRASTPQLFGLDRVVEAPSGVWVASLGDGPRPDVVVEAVGHQVSTLQHAIEACAVEGEIIYFGIPDDDIYPLDMERLMRKRLTLRGGVTCRRREMLIRANDYLLTHRDALGELVTDELPVQQAQQAFELAVVPVANRRKIVLSMA